MSSDDSITQPLTTARLESFDGTEENQRNSPSPHTMLASSLQNGNAYHHYANPQQLKPDVEIELAKLDGRKKKNLIYDAVAPLEKASNGHPLLPPRNIENNNTYVEKQQKNKNFIYRCVIICMVVFIVALSAVVYFVLSLKQSRQQSSSSPLNGKMSDSLKGFSIDDQKLHELQTNFTHMAALQRNLTHLTEHVLPELQKEVQILRQKVNNQPEGRRGPVGPAGPPGVADFTKCQYKTYERRNIIDQRNPQNSETTSTYVGSSNEYFIMGVTCSSEGAAQYSLIRKLNSKAKRVFACKCAGETKHSDSKENISRVFCKHVYYKESSKTKAEYFAKNLDKEKNDNENLATRLYCVNKKSGND